MTLQGRMGLARTAAHAVVDTLTWRDNLAIIAFSHSDTLVFPSTATLSSMTDANKATAKTAIDAVSEGGKTQPSAATTTIAAATHP